MKKLAVIGVCGKMGSSITAKLLEESDIEIIGGIDIVNVGYDIGEIINTGLTGRKIYKTFEDLKSLKPNLLLDFTNIESSKKAIEWALENSVDIIVGSTGFNKSDLNLIENKAIKSKSRVFIVPNFSIGAVIMAEISAIAAKYFESCEIIELHHDKKKDAPSGTSLLTAEKISSKLKTKKLRLNAGEKETLQGSRGAFVNGVHIHSIRLPGLLAHQEVLFGTVGQTLSIRHDSLDRNSFYPGVIMTIRSIDKLGNFTYGLDKIMKFE